MSPARPGPLFLLAGAVGGWVLIRSLFLVLSAPVPLLGLPTLIETEPADFAQAYAPSARHPATTLQAGIADYSMPRARARLRPRLGQHPQAVLAQATRPTPVSERLMVPAPYRSAGAIEVRRDTHLVGAQSLLLARMLDYRASAHSRRIGAVTPLVGHQGLPSFIPARRVAADRWSMSAGLYVRRGPGAPPLSGAVPLGGTQAWARLGWQPGIAGTEIFARATSAGRLGDGAEAAFGLAVQPMRGLPVRVVAERRQRIGDAGRSAFAAYAVGGTSVDHGGWRLDGYGAAGVVGVRNRDGFAEGSATLGRPVARIGPVELSAGGGAWGAAQPGVHRVDMGPMLTVRTERVDGARLALDWRQRVAGNATPDSGPSLSLSVDF